tara:strand:+ start:146 stop:301 length:156 start_codon:yes stop_codon:yes gene_type:complete
MSIIAPFKVYALDKNGFFKKPYKEFSNEELKVFIYFSKTVHNPDNFYSCGE